MRLERTSDPAAQWQDQVLRLAHRQGRVNAFLRQELTVVEGPRVACLRGPSQSPAQRYSVAVGAGEGGLSFYRHQYQTLYLFRVGIAGIFGPNSFSAQDAPRLSVVSAHRFFVDRAPYDASAMIQDDPAYVVGSKQLCSRLVTQATDAAHGHEDAD